MTLALDILEWAKDKPDLAEIHYENKANGAPIEITIKFDSSKPNVSINENRLAYIEAPAIGRLALDIAKTQPGQRLNAGELIGHIEGAAAPSRITSPLSGKVLRAVAAHGAPIGYGDPIILLEIKN
ncbi:MAG: hypothetical protein HY547_07830 [Elusimicrobia bacterium]|nr:hypothetical protein [Elusimicrobiota bacterium]